MVRTRLASLALALSLGCLSGCCWPGIFCRPRACCGTAASPAYDSCCSSSSPVLEGPVLPVPPDAHPPADSAQLPVAPPPRLVPQPQSAPVPYSPSGIRVAK
jgi:hypothetical protein